MTRKESAQSVLTPRDELNGFAAKVEPSAGKLVSLNQQFELHVGEAFTKVKEECGNLTCADFRVYLHRFRISL